MIRRQVIVFAKAPRLGSVKTRLARDIGQTRALCFYRQSLADTLNAASALPKSQVSIYTSPDNAVAGRYSPRYRDIVGQGHGDLGRRMARALDDYPLCHRILVGGDIPDIRRSDLEDALAALNRCDAVFGPAEDGGFWLVGLRAGFRPRGLFKSMRWSHSRVLAEALATLPCHATIAFVRTLNDIDDAEDYRRFLASA